MKLIWNEVHKYESSDSVRCFYGFNRYGDIIARVLRMKYRTSETWEAAIIKNFTVCENLCYFNTDEIIQFTDKNSAIIASEKHITDDGTGV